MRLCRKDRRYLRLRQTKGGSRKFVLISVKLKLVRAVISISHVLFARVSAEGECSALSFEL